MIEVKTIESLVNLGYDILYLADIHKDEQYWIVSTFNEPVKTGVESVDYGMVTGVNITDFLKINHVQLQNQVKLFENALQKCIEESSSTRLKFSDNHTWRLFTK